MQFWNQMENSNSTRAVVCCFFQTHNMQNITTQCSSIHKFIILGPSGPKPVLQLCALRCPDLSVKSHRVTGDSQPDSLTDWSISQLCRQKAANGCSSHMPRHRGTITTSAQACWYLLVPRQWGPGSQSDSVHSGLVPNPAAPDSPLAQPHCSCLWDVCRGWVDRLQPWNNLLFSVPLFPLKHHHTATLNFETASSLLE